MIVLIKENNSSRTCIHLSKSSKTVCIGGEVTLKVAKRTLNYLKEQVPKRIISISDLDSVENQLSVLNLLVLKLVVMKYCDLF